MRHRLVYLALLAAGPACSQPSIQDDAPAMTATVVPAEDGAMRVTFRFTEESPLWAFRRSAVTMDGNISWRAQSWTVETPGVELRKLGLHEALVPVDGPMPDEVTVRFTPFTDLLVADYPAALRLTDGTLGYFSDHFTLRPAPSSEAVEGLGADIHALPAYDGDNPKVTFLSGGQAMRHDGKLVTSALLEQGGYVLYGPAKPLETPHIAATIDPGLPAWLSMQLNEDIPALMELYAGRLGTRSGDKPELIVSWAGPTAGRISLGGSVIGDTIIMRIEGDRLTERSDAAYDYARQFIAHEAAHFWLGNTVDYGDPGDAWTTEGGADLVAQRAAQILDPAYSSRRWTDKAINDCAELAKAGPMKTAPERNGQDAFYACGAVFSLVAETVEQKHGGDFFSFWKRLIDANREDGTVSVDEWLEALRDAGAERDTVRMIATMHETGVEDPRATIAALLESVGIALRTDRRGRLRLA